MPVYTRPADAGTEKKALRTGYCFRRRRYGWTALSRQPHLPRASAGLRVPGRCTVGQSLVAPQSGYGHAVIGSFYGEIDAILDGGKTALGTPSTIISLADGKPALIRAGALPEAEWKEILTL